MGPNLISVHRSMRSATVGTDIATVAIMHNLIHNKQVNLLGKLAIAGPAIDIPAPGTYMGPFVNMGMHHPHAGILIK